MRSRVLICAIAVAAGVSALAPMAYADAQGEKPAETVPNGAKPEQKDAPTSTPLTMRPSQPLELAHEPPSNAGAWKMLGLAGLVAAGAWMWKRKRESANVAKKVETLTILRRASIGVRSELIIVQVEGQRLLLGVTPHAIQSLAILPDSDEAPEAAQREIEHATGTEAQDSVGTRFAAVLEAASAGRAVASAPVPIAKRAQPVERVEEDALEGQARGLLKLRGGE